MELSNVELNWNQFDPETLGRNSIWFTNILKERKAADIGQWARIHSNMVKT